MAQSACTSNGFQYTLGVRHLETTQQVSDGPNSATGAQISAVPSSYHEDDTWPSGGVQRYFSENLLI
jgi:hypothetical protein